jgi:hypothetical protein
VLAGIAWLVLSAGYWCVVRDVSEQPSAGVVVAGVLAFSVCGVAWNLWRAIAGFPEAASLRRAQRGLPLEDGRLEAASGTIELLGEPLEAPFSGRPCAAYEYTTGPPAFAHYGYGAIPSGHPRGQEGSRIEGQALAPSFVRSARGNIRILGFGPLWQYHPEKNFSDDEAALERTLRYLDRTRFPSPGLQSFAELARSAEATPEGSVRRDWQRNPANSGRCMRYEKVVGVGETVTVLGLWDEARSGLAPRKGDRTADLRLLSGDLNAALGIVPSRLQAWGRAVGYFAFSCLVHAPILYGLSKGTLGPK